MGKKRRQLKDKPAAVQTPSAAHPEFLSFIEKRASLIAIAAVILASARIIATYTVFNHTFDEPVHIACGMEWLDKGVYTWEAQHPPLSRVAGAIGPYLLGVRYQNQDRKVENPKLQEGLKILYAGHHYDLTLAMARLGILPFFWIACLVVYEWGRRYFNRTVAVLAVCSFSFLPPVLAHAGLATTDMALTAFLGAAFLTLMMWVERPTPARAAWFGLCGGLAILSKFSCLVFFPAAAGAAFLWYAATERPPVGHLFQQFRRRLTTLPLAALVGCLVIWGGYRFSVGKVPPTNLVLPAPELYAGIREVQIHNRGGHYSYLLGERGTQGWWYFFPVVLAVKTPLAFSILVGVWVFLAVKRRLGFQLNWVPAAFAASIMAVGMTSHINIGLRHILPIYIGLSLLAAMAAYWMLQQVGERRWRVVAVALLAAWFAASSLLSHPDYLPYFNELAGDHPENIVADSDLDWGQDIKRLAKRLKEVGAQEVTLSTALVADFETEHGIPHRIDKMDVIHPPSGWVAIGISWWKEYRLGLFDRFPQYVLWPDRFPPAEKVGKSILLWYFPPGSPDR